MPSDTAEHSPVTAQPEKIWWVYMVRAENGHLYTGISLDPERRLQEHVSGKRGARFFNRSPASALVWRERCVDKSAALRRELAVKALRKAAKERLILLQLAPAHDE
ncbi:MAG: GIY-YIG nuclease family protein [Pseudomonas sp.]